MAINPQSEGRRRSVGGWIHGTASSLNRIEQMNRAMNSLQIDTSGVDPQPGTSTPASKLSVLLIGLWIANVSVFLYFLIRTEWSSLVAR